MREIFERRSIRRFTEEAVSVQDLELLLRAAMQAPSAGNEQPWEFVVIEKKDTMEAIMEFHEYATPLKTAPLAIAVCGDLKKQRFQDYWIQDCCAATENLLLEATHLGLGTVWMGVYPIEKRVLGIQKVLNLPETVVPLCVVAVGHPAVAEDVKRIDRYNPECIHREMWE